MEETQDITLRQMLRDHMNQSANFQLEVKTSLAKIEVHGKYTRESISDHENRIGKLHDASNRQKGAVWTASGFGFLALIKLLKDIFW